MGRRCNITISDLGVNTQIFATEGGGGERERDLTHVQYFRYESIEKFTKIKGGIVKLEPFQIIYGKRNMGNILLSQMSINHGQMKEKKRDGRGQRGRFCDPRNCPSLLHTSHIQTTKACDTIDQYLGRCRKAGTRDSVTTFH